MHGFFFWEYSLVANCLMLCSEDTGRRIRTSLTKEMLNQSIASSCDCEVGDFFYFSDVQDVLSHFPLTEEQREFVAYSAVATRLFLLPSQPKSWFFLPQVGVEDDGLPQLVQAQLKDSQQWINLLLVQIVDGVADCLLLDPTLSLPGLNIKFAQPLRIFTNRLSPAEYTQSVKEVDAVDSLLQWA